jgi:dihydrodipicolinate synthase/N-acetylneuraminate lyase
VTPELFVEVYEEYMKGRTSKSRLAQEKILETAPIFFGDGLKPGALKAGIRESIRSGAPVGASDGVPICVTKEAMRQRGYPVSPLVRDPLPQLRRYQKERIARVLKETGLLS